MSNNAHRQSKSSIQRRFRTAIRACDVASVREVLSDIDGDLNLIGELKKYLLWLKK